MELYYKTKPSQVERILSTGLEGDVKLTGQKEGAQLLVNLPDAQNVLHRLKAGEPGEYTFRGRILPGWISRI